MKRFICLAWTLAVALPAGLAFGDRLHVKVSADCLRVLHAATGEVAQADGHVRIEIPGLAVIEAPQAQLIKGSDGQLAEAVFPEHVTVTGLATGGWHTESNTGGEYDFKTGQFTEFHPKGNYELTPHPKGAS